MTFMPNSTKRSSFHKGNILSLLVLSTVLGMIFPLLATLFVVKAKTLVFSWEVVQSIHFSDPTMFIVDIAGVFLFGLFLTLGIRQLQLDQTNRMLTSKSKDLNLLLIETQKKNRELDQFSYIVTHDLKAPLRGARNLLNWIAEDVIINCSIETQTNIKTLENRLTYMDRLITDILTYSKTGKTDLEKEQVDTNELVAEVISNLDIQHRFKIHVEENMPKIHAPRIYVQQVFMNLISNAAKYHDKFNGTIEIKYALHHGHVEFSVSDDGPGIDPKYHAKIFELFQTLNVKESNDGTGVGLAIVKKIVTDVKGKIKVESQVNKGSRFIIEWPYKPAA